MSDPVDERLVDTLRSARNVVALTGAGVSAESGIATFRDDETGLWSRFSIEEFGSPEGFARQPGRVWEWYVERRDAMLRARPNPAHLALARLERHVASLTVITQNIDGLHQRAGSTRVLELHGSIRTVRCGAADHGPFAWPEGRALAHCPVCGAPLRPNVVWFGERLDSGRIQAADRAAQECDVLLAIGTSGLVAPAATFPMTARAHGARLVDINPVATPLSRHARHVLRGPAGELLPPVVAAAWPD
ncbi:MAG TPA: NAD-dependent deacylase [Herpetosiphonaceae bacterium]|nr:NAD-dependent deacylase [Herpetosiphonaceae bacterium]